MPADTIDTAVDFLETAPEAPETEAPPASKESAVTPPGKDLDFLSALDVAFGDTPPAKPGADKKDAGAGKDEVKAGEGDAEIPLEEGEIAWWKEKKQGEAFGAIKKEAAAAKKRAAELEAEVLKLKEPAEKTGLLEQRAAELEEKLARYNIEESREWQEKVSGPIGALEKAAKKLDDSGELLSALAEPDVKARRKRLNAVIEDQEMNQVEQNRVWKLAEEAEELLDLADDMRKSAAGKLGEWKEKERLEGLARTKAEQEKYVATTEGALGKFRQHLAKAGLEELLVDADTGELTEGAKRLLLKAKNKSWNGADVQVLAYHGLAGELFPAVLSEASKLKAEVARLKKELGDMDRATPGGGGGGGGSPGKGGAGVDNGGGSGNFLDSVDAAFERMKRR